jgi:xanthine dehydrogenase YagS FAD-binding subunit
MLRPFGYVRAGTLEEAVRAAARPGAHLLAGGTDLLGCLRDGVFAARELVSLSGLSALGGITPTAEGGLRIGALATLAEVAQSERVRKAYPLLAQAAAQAASPQLRNQGTIGGNLCQRPRCWYYRGEFHCARKGGDTCYAVAGENRYHALFGGHGCFIVHPSDTAPALVALGAEVLIVGPGGRRTVPLESFFVLPAAEVSRENVLEAGELITEVLVPPPWPGLRSLYRKVRERGAWDFALVGVALALRTSGERVEDARVVLSGVAPVPWRSLPVEQVLVGGPLDPGVASRAGLAAIEGAAPLEQNEYKVPLLRGTVEDAVLTLAAVASGEGPTPRR